ncbi:MAG TPA: type II secretion system protein [Vicinamibacterales bacterium]|nr:type II secretion system protein [Vicinamibacterales bacterium]
MTRLRSESGFSLMELLVATGILLVVSGVVTQALLQMTTSQATIWNRTEMHSGIRGATELLQQEVGQAGRLSLPVTLTLTNAVPGTGGCDYTAPTSNAVPYSVTSKDANGLTVTSVPGIQTNGVYGTVNPLTFLFAAGGGNPAYELLTTMDGPKQETIKLASVDPPGGTITACFAKQHDGGTVLMPLGAFANGVLPNTGVANGSTASVLKLFGDINGDGNLVYVEYKCDTVAGNLYRNVMAYNQTAKPAVSNSNILLSNIIANPGGTACFNYQSVTMTVQGTQFTFVLDVSVTLTVQSEQIDPITKQKQTETKALLNVSPRNVFNAWSLAALDYTDRIQSTPVSVTTLLP